MRRHEIIGSTSRIERDAAYDPGLDEHAPTRYRRARPCRECVNRSLQLFADFDRVELLQLRACGVSRVLVVRGVVELLPQQPRRAAIATFGERGRRRAAPPR